MLNLTSNVYLKSHQSSDWALNVWLYRAMIYGSSSSNPPPGTVLSPLLDRDADCCVPQFQNPIVQSWR